MTESVNGDYRSLGTNIDAIVGAWLVAPTPTNEQQLRHMFRTVYPAEVYGGAVWEVLTWSDLRPIVRILAEELAAAMGYQSVPAMSAAMGFNLVDPNLAAGPFRDAVNTVIVPFIRRHGPMKVMS